MSGEIKMTAEHRAVFFEVKESVENDRYRFDRKNLHLAPLCKLSANTIQRGIRWRMWQLEAMSVAIQQM